MQHTLAWVAVVAVLSGGAQAQGPQVTLPELGTLEGYMGSSFATERPFYHFRAVPFAKPPINELRFKAPEPVEPWTGIYDAHTNFGHRCPQVGPVGRIRDSWQSVVEDMAFSRAEEEESREDCLFLQVYSPNIDPAANLPVLVFFHGGAFNTGSSRLYGGNKFMEHDIVLVVPHYRLGPFGFLSLHTDEIPGNAGMLDQVEALRWVQKYVSYFGGDPNKVTIMGESSGGVSTSMLSLSPLSSNLFNQYISQSGSAIANWGLDPDPVRSTIEIGLAAGCNDTETTALTECLMSVDAVTLNLAYSTFRGREMAAGRNSFGGSSPIVQKAGAQRFLERTPRDMYLTGDYVGKPALLGANKHEGTMTYTFVHQFFLKANDLHENEEYLTKDFSRFYVGFLGASDQGDTMAIAVENTYFGKENMGNLTLMTPGIIDFTSNMYIKGGMYQTADLNTAMGGTTYLYAFNYVGSQSIFTYFELFAPIPGGVCHANDLLLLFTVPTFSTDDQDNIVSSNMINLWVNFVKYGNPSASPLEGVPTWPAWTKEQGDYMVIDKEFTVRQDYKENEYFVSINENFPNA